MSSDRPGRSAEEEPNYLLEAFKSQYNLIGLGTAVGFAILSGSFLPMLLAAGLELTLLPFAERLARYKRARDRDQAEKQRKVTEVSDMMGSLTHEERQRYRTLEVLAGEIRSNYKGLDSSSQVLLDDLVRKLDFLLAFYLRMRHSLMRYVSYFATTDPDEIRYRIGELEREMGSGPERVRAIKARTRAVLQKRMQRFEKARENKDMIEAQTETVQEVLRLLRDQSYSIRDPRSITEQLDGLVSSSEQTERGVKDMENLLDVQHDLVMPRVHDGDIEAELERGRAAPERAASAPQRLRLPETAPPGSPPPPPRKKITH
jgi:chromosome segregation ATPase